MTSLSNGRPSRFLALAIAFLCTCLSFSSTLELLLLNADRPAAVQSTVDPMNF
jgi:hypothetical protein